MLFLNKLKPFILYIIIGVLSFIIFTNRCSRKLDSESNVQIDTLYVPYMIPPTPIVFSDTIFLPTPLVKKEPVIDSSLLRKYEDALTQIKRDSIFKAAISINEYKETFEDSLSKITVNSKIRGSLLEQSLDYELKARRIDVPEITITKEKRQVFAMGLGADIYIPTTGLGKLEFGGNLFIQNARGDVYEIGVTTEKRVLLGYKIAIFRIKR